MEGKELHPSTLTSFNICSYKYRYDKSPVSLQNTYHWSLLDSAWASGGDMWPHIDHYLDHMTLPKNVNKMKMNNYLERSVENIRNFVNSVKDRRYEYYLQTKMFLPREQDGIKYLIVGTPDFYYHNKKTDERICVDGKWSSKSNFETPDTFDSLQPPIYARFIMERHKVDKVRFAFFVSHKYSGDMAVTDEVYTKERCDDEIKKVLLDWEYAHNFEEFNPKKSKNCGFCPFRTNWKCPLRGNSNFITID